MEPKELTGQQAPHEECPQTTGTKPEDEKWEKPTLEDVSEKIMAQPYIRFT